MADPKDILDQTLPPELQKVVAMIGAGNSTPAQPTTQEPSKGDSNMDTSKEQVVAAVKEVLAANNRKQAITDKIESLTNQAATAKANLERTVADAASAKSGFESQIASLQNKVSEAEKAIASKDGEIAALKAQLGEKDKAIAEKTRQINTMQTDKAIAARTAALKEAGLASDDRVARFTAKTDDGTLKVNDADFDMAVSELKAAYAAGKASVKPGEKGTETPAAPQMESGKATQATAALLNGGAQSQDGSRRSIYAQIKPTE